MDKLIEKATKREIQNKIFLLQGRGSLDKQRKDNLQKSSV